jgi:hypothetical protein
MLLLARQDGTLGRDRHDRVFAVGRIIAGGSWTIGRGQRLPEVLHGGHRGQIRTIEAEGGQVVLLSHSFITASR